jgi:hypothetical protein
MCFGNQGCAPVCKACLATFGLLDKYMYEQPKSCKSRVCKACLATFGLLDKYMYEQPKSCMYVSTCMGDVSTCMICSKMWSVWKGLSHNEYRCRAKYEFHDSCSGWGVCMCMLATRDNKHISTICIDAPLGTMLCLKCDEEYGIVCMWLIWCTRTWNRVLLILCEYLQAIG